MGYILNPAAMEAVGPGLVGTDHFRQRKHQGRDESVCTWGCIRPSLKAFLWRELGEGRLFRRKGRRRLRLGMERFPSNAEDNREALCILKGEYDTKTVNTKQIGASVFYP